VGRISCSGDRLHRVRAANRLRAGFRQAEMSDLAFADEVFHRAGDVLDRHVRIHAMLVEEIDAVGPQPLQRGIGDLADMRRPAVEAGLFPVLDPEAELGRDDDLIAHGSERLAYQLFVDERPVNLSRVEEGDAVADGLPDDGTALGGAGRRAVAVADPHAAEPEG
jgi:hypothetical protein